MDEYRVRCIFDKIDRNKTIRVKVPGSKSITNRALLIAALAEGETILKGALFSNDAKNMISCLNALGIKMEIDEENETITVQGCGGRLTVREADINVGSAGTAARFLTALLAFSAGVYHLDASEQMKKRPMKPLLDALIKLGAIISYDEAEGHFPFTIDSRAVKGGEISLDTCISSQFLSAVVMTGFLLPDGLKVNIAGGRESLPYVDMTARVHLDSIQGDIEFVKLLTKMGARLEDEVDGILLYGANEGSYDGIEANLNSFSDQSLTLAAVSAFAKSPTKITGISHIRMQESDRLLAIKNELEKLGVGAVMGDGEISIFPKAMDENEVYIETYDDHRVAMAFALVGLRRGGVVIKNPDCTAKTFKDYFKVLDEIR